MTMHFRAVDTDGRTTRTTRTAATPVSAETPIATAREFTASCLDGWAVAETARDDAILLVSELVTNAVVHGRAPIELQLRRRPGELRIEVRDTATALPRLRPIGPGAASGRGLHIVAAIAREWGVRREPAGKTVWSALRLPRR
jgi:anti-sigma regulatory factor (Ser/Thr protein kinase)